MTSCKIPNTKFKLYTAFLVMIDTVYTYWRPHTHNNYYVNMYCMYNVLYIHVYCILAAHMLLHVYTCIQWNLSITTP